MKNLSLPVAVVVAIIGCGLAVIANVTTSRMDEDLSREQYHRMEAERQLQEANQTVLILQKSLKVANSKIESIEGILNQGKAATSNMKTQLDAVSQEKAALQKRLQELQGQLAPEEVEVP